jgi:hypothetical protein
MGSVVDHAHESINHSSRHFIFEKQFFHLIHLVIECFLHCSVFALEEVRLSSVHRPQQGHIGSSPSFSF